MNQKSFLFLLVPDFPLLCLSSAIDTLRIANRMTGTDFYSWKTASIDGSAVSASCGLDIPCSLSFPEIRKAVQMVEHPDAVFVVAGIDPSAYSSKSLSALLRETASKKIIVGGICTGSLLVAEAGLLNGKKGSIHWEEITRLQTDYPEIHVVDELFTKDGTIWTCAGGSTAIDLFLSVVEQDFGKEISLKVRDQQIGERIREATSRQLPANLKYMVNNKVLIEAIEFMQANIEEPLRLSEIAAYMKISRRQLERLFQKHLNNSPARFYLNLRLSKAREMLKMSNISIVDISLACGFVSPSHFSKSYRETFGTTPQQSRQ